MTKPKIKIETVCEVLRETKGMVYLAARRLHVSHVTIYSYAKRYPAVQEAIDAERGVVLDNCELRLNKAISNDQPWAITFALATIGRHRGYTREGSQEPEQKITIERVKKKR